MANAIAQTDGLSRVTPGGAFCALINCQRLLDSRSTDGTALVDDVAFVDFVLKQARVAGVPGSVYELGGHFRTSTATDDGTLSTVLVRTADALRQLTRPKEP